MKKIQPLHIIITIIVIILLLITSLNICDSLQVDTVKVKVNKLVTQQIIGKESTKYRYLIITDNETFICENNILHGKFNNSDLFYKIKENQTYIFFVCGYGKTWYSDYRNVLDIK
jgi:hypothetical protein